MYLILLILIHLQLTKIGIYRNYNNDRRILTRIMIFFQLLIVIEMFIGYFLVRILKIKFDSMPLDNGFYLFTIGIPLSYSTLFVITLHSVDSRMQSVIKCLDISNMTALNNYWLKKRIKLLMIICDKLNDTIMSINRYYVFSAMISLFNLAVVNIMTTFLNYDVIAHELLLEDFILTLGGYSYSLCTGIGLVVIIFYSENIKRAFDKITVKVLDISMYLNESGVCGITHVAYLQLYSLKKEIAGGLFAFRWSICFSVLATIFDYLIIMIQFDNSLK